MPAVERPHRLFAMLVVALMGAGPAAAAPIAAELHAAQWRVRPVVVAGPSPDDPRVKGQLAAFARHAAAVADYQIKLIALTPPDDAARRQLGLTDAFAVILIGKDGGEKGRWTAPVDPQKIFAEIDAMPMRQDERRRR